MVTADYEAGIESIVILLTHTCSNEIAGQVDDFQIERRQGGVVAGSKARSRAPSPQVAVLFARASSLLRLF